MRLPILMYHKVDRPPPPPGARYLRNYVLPEQFDARPAALRRWGYGTISFADWLAYRRRERTLPRRPIILTFDDGYRSTYEVAWPLLKRYAATATVFLVSDLIGRTSVWDSSEIQEPLLGAGEITAMRAGGIEFGSHTCTHPALTALPPPRVLAELRDSRTALAQLLGAPVRVLCYPFGKQNAAVRALAREAGYEAAVIARRRLNSSTSDPSRLTPGRRPGGGPGCSRVRRSPRSPSPGSPPCPFSLSKRSPSPRATRWGGISSRWRRARCRATRYSPGSAWWCGCRPGSSPRC